MTEQSTVMAKKVLKALGDVLHALQRERGMACLYLDSNGEIYSERSRGQLVKTNDSIEELHRILKDASLLQELPVYSEARLNEIKGRLEKLDKFRDAIRSKTLRYANIINDYTFEYNLPIIDTMVEFAHRTKSFNSALVGAYANFLQWKELMGRERALGSRGLYSKAFRNIEFTDRMLGVIAEQDSYFSSFKSLASPSQLTIVQPTIDGEDMKAIQKIHALIKNAAPPADIEKYDVSTWFELMTRTIDNLHDAEQSIVDQLTGETGAVTPLTHINAKGDNATANEYGEFVRDMALFSGLSDGDLTELLSFAQVRTHKRGNLLFLQGEPASRLYIILQGWVKVYNGTADGEETILQMLCTGDTLLESAVFLNAPTPISAQVVEDAILLSIPSPIIRQRVQSSNDLAVSMLNNVSLRSQRLIHQMEQSRLKSARERVGWFLLRLYMSQKHETDSIHLPYDKSIIASYLNMRPETFSRTLKKLRDEGIEIFKDRIQLPDAKSLCKFCDNYIAEDCEYAGTEECPDPDVDVIGMLVNE